jgi:hypothetical protein
VTFAPLQPVDGALTVRSVEADAELLARYQDSSR